MSDISSDTNDVNDIDDINNNYSDDNELCRMEMVKRIMNHFAYASDDDVKDIYYRFVVGSEKNDNNKKIINVGSGEDNKYAIALTIINEILECIGQYKIRTLTDLSVKKDDLNDKEVLKIIEKNFDLIFVNGFDKQATKYYRRSFVKNYGALFVMSFINQIEGYECITSSVRRHRKSQAVFTVVKK